VIDRAGAVIERAVAADVDAVAAILTEAADWVAGLDHPQWPSPFPREQVVQLVERGELYVARLDGEVAATVTLQWSDVPYWGERPPDAGYVHKLAVRRDFAGRGVGHALVAWAEAETLAHGRSYLRLDCLAANPRIRRYYEELGFAGCGEIERGGLRMALYERDCR
jgi:ribosomal protein S18 acetylase RimI-like enzyme